MKNTIMKSYLKKILRSEAFVSVIIVFVLALGIIGTSYALYMDVDTDIDYQLVKSGDLSISFEEGTDILKLDNILPLEDEDVISGTQKPSTYTFSILNTGTYNTLYDIKLELLDGSTIEKKDIKFLLCKETCAEKTVEDIKTLDELENMLIHSDKILKDSETSDTYVIKVWLSSDYVGDTERNLQLKIIVDARNESIKFLNDTIMNDARIMKNDTIPQFLAFENNEMGMYSSEDDYGISWYFRGAQNYNYVNFAGFTWRIVRINGDGSIRLILDGTLDKVKKDEIYVASNTKLSSLYSVNKGAFNTKTDDNAYVGYMYGEFDGNSTSYDEAHQNKVSSSIKMYVDVFYEEYLKTYEDYFADVIFCGDKTLRSDLSTSTNGFGKKTTVYSSINRFSGVNNPAYPTFECAKGAENTYSRYTAESEKTIKGVRVNSDLTYPIGLLSVDELVFAGGHPTNSSGEMYPKYYLATVNASTNWWTMTPSSWNGNTFIYYGTSIYSLHNHWGTDDNGVRPVINLKATSIVDSGNGTYESPYEIKLD